MTVPKKLQQEEKYRTVAIPSIIRECTACPVQKGCMTDLVCHTASVEIAIRILQCGSLLSAVRSRNLPGEVLRKEQRNAANDPADFFHYVMASYESIIVEKLPILSKKWYKYIRV